MMGLSAAHLRGRLGNRGLAAAAGLLVVLVVLFATPQLLGTRLAAAFGRLDQADAKWLWLAGVGFAVAVVGAAGSWRSAIRLCGGRLSLTDACARYGAGSLVNTFVPARAGAALGIHQPLAAAIVIVPALDIAGLVPITPGNVGVTSGAIAIAFQANGVSFTHGLAAGIAFHAVETAVGIMFGLASLVWLAPYP